MTNKPTKSSRGSKKTTDKENATPNDDGAAAAE